MSQLSFRPEGYEGSVEQYLSKVRNAIVNALAQAQKGLSHATLGLERPFLQALATILVEFAEDLHCESGASTAKRLTGTAALVAVKICGADPWGADHP